MKCFRLGKNHVVPQNSTQMPSYRCSSSYGHASALRIVSLLAILSVLRPAQARKDQLSEHSSFCDLSNLEFAKYLKVQKVLRNSWSIHGMVATKDISRGQRILVVPMQCVLREDEMISGSPAENLLQNEALHNLFHTEFKVQSFFHSSHESTCWAVATLYKAFSFLA